MIPSRMPTITPLMSKELDAVRAGHGRYWPNGTAITSLRALERKGLVRFVAGYGWRLTEKMHAVSRLRWPSC